ncbi:decaprenyl-diphosphate synthase subunit 1-like [Diaphorina citri]|uniref:Decaprenyl-diphosphate synthase subunit 1-like n=1 Tax=Diaphorina citri TaxID=121845 RepID=A0A3Q0JH65_DIACI|nr:decaprenyl-diphosphate synthase subunit 1-like [Diaphorina citri]
MVSVLMGRAINYHLNRNELTEAQRQVAMFAEMIHTASLIHDDVIDQSDFRRGKPSVNVVYNHKKVSVALNRSAMLGGADDKLSEVAFEYGRNLGIAFQLVDDLLDFISSSDAMGKPTAADLKLGLATAPVLFACEKFPELNPMIMRRFQEPGDVEKAFEFVHKSQGLEQTKFLARKHCVEAVRLASGLAESPYQKGLVVLTDLVLNRMK